MTYSQAVACPPLLSTAQPAPKPTPVPPQPTQIPASSQINTTLPLPQPILVDHTPKTLPQPILADHTPKTQMPHSTQVTQPSSSTPQETVTLTRTDLRDLFQNFALTLAGLLNASINKEKLIQTCDTVINTTLKASKAITQKKASPRYPKGRIDNTQEKNALVKVPMKIPPPTQNQSDNNQKEDTPVMVPSPPQKSLQESEVLETLLPASCPVGLRGYSAHSLPRVAGDTQGSIILIKEHIRFTPIASPVHCGGGVEVQGIILQLAHSTLTVYNIYNNSSGHLDISELLPLAATETTLIAGDFNCHHQRLHSCSPTNRDGRHLAGVLESTSGVTLLNTGKPTHVRGGRLDLTFVSSTLQHSAKWNIHPTLTSDHFAIYCQLDINPLPPPSPNPPRWNMRKANWDTFRQSIEKQLKEIRPPDDLDKHEEFLTNIFHKAANEAIPLTKPCKKQRKDHWFYNERVRVLKNRLNAARRLNRRHPSDKNRALLRAVVQLTHQEKKKIQEQKWIEWCQGIDSHTTLSSMWSKLKAVSGKKVSAPPSHSNPQQEAEHLASSFATRSSSTQLPDSTIHTLARLLPERKSEVELACLAEADTDPPITHRELLSAQKRSKDTAPGRDKITYSMIRLSGPAGHAAMLGLLNISWSKGVSNWGLRSTSSKPRQ
ncbi:hypothetical protein Pcinc_043131 [Petrolisthes cinctipes]|uniref:Endonuclease/exonuclease/phosphatase domain-containing protein n=1 Tax=Petrolisthes cinctipes TaxID=88211 RepID=A0AAE1BHA4_PETCI|nr:hypothetical protein Pcinc_043131 [Petrolisthes cinctipes]